MKTEDYELNDFVKNHIDHLNSNYFLLCIGLKCIKFHRVADLLYRKLSGLSKALS